MKFHIGEAPQANQGGRKHPDRDKWYGYQWPATKLTDEHRRHLNLMSNSMGRRVTQLIAEAVKQMYENFVRVDEQT